MKVRDYNAILSILCHCSGLRNKSYFLETIEYQLNKRSISFRAKFDCYRLKVIAQSSSCNFAAS